MTAPLRPAALALLALLVALLAPVSAGASETVPGEVVVKFRAGATAAAAARGPEPVGHPRTLRVRSVPAALRRLRARADVVYAVPNVKARIAGFVPNDPGRGKTPGGWAEIQWNFAGPFGVNAPDAWQRMIELGRAGGRGVTVAVLDTGVAYRARRGFLQSPDLTPSRFVQGYDFVDGDPFANDRNGHGTHVASTIAERTGNGYGLTGLAYNATIMPVRVLDDRGEGDAAAIARGVRWAARRGAQVINLSLEFGTEVQATEIPELLDAIRYAHRRGSLVVGASGNDGSPALAYPARATDVLAVGSTTEHGCLSSFSNTGSGLDLVAPGGGEDAPLADDPSCAPDIRSGRDISQVTLMGAGKRRFGIPGTYEGTSMAAPHASAVAALAIASGAIGPDPSPAAIERHLERTARDLGAPGFDARYGAGLLDAAAAVRPAP